ncbi:MAG: peptidase S10 [Gammaproteobacteria bacterium]|nr:peptidase S10 [Gammaproteobacteria bacterium]MBU6510314.1 peptidase S10 [Gammaproteobacteria bacterium]MDE1983857.1 peptidase S10 [Gammaproteobacteria bacterium]MDE2107989.1 peptidase S10 [Gammaproteobacteria bacterium]MDE2461817.1 peptidase S10 [Gammaproteobacteria bacterium]
MVLPAFAADKPSAQPAAPAGAASATPQESTTTGTVTVEGQTIHYKAVAGTIILKNKDDKPTGSMFYVAYFKDGANANNRPVTFFYNGGPGSSTVWLHMGAFGPQRVVTADHTHTPAAPYGLVNNDYSLLDATDEVFIDAMGTGFSRVLDKEHGGEGSPKDFYGVDEDGRTFAQFITQFLSKYGRWNSPKYLFGESYGTTRSAVLANDLETNDDVDLNGVILLSEILNFDLNTDFPQINPGVDLPYELMLPTFAATAWFHHKLPNQPGDLHAFLQQVEQFAMGDYAKALQAGATLDSASKQQIAEQLHNYTGLPVNYLLKANLRVSGPQFEHELLNGNDDLAGRLDTRFSGPAMDPLAEQAAYDPQSAAISSAYVSAFNNYVRKDLKFGDNMVYNPEIDVFAFWDFKHQPPGAPFALPFTPNVMPDLASAMIYNPNLKVLLNSGYFDLATPFYAAVYTMHHLPMPDRLQSNIQYAFYDSGHMVYVHVPSLKELHDNTAKFIESTHSAQ